MRSLWVIGGVFAGRKAFGLPGAVLGAGLGYALCEISDILRRLEAVERGTAGVAETSAAARSAERYPEESIIDAMQQAEEEKASRGEETEDLFSEVSGEKKQLH